MRLPGIAALVAGLSACSAEETGAVTGTFLLRDEPLAGTEVTIDGRLNWRATTGPDGAFVIDGVVVGERQLHAVNELDDGRVVALGGSVYVTAEGADLGEMNLPEPPVLAPIEPAAVTATEVPLSWSAYAGIGFREYKVYRKDDPGLDETTGELIFVTTDPEETTFVDTEFTPGPVYYYRVYVLVETGKLGGSNLESADTPAENLVANGGFEAPPTAGDPVPEWTEVNGLFAQDTESFVSGAASLSLTVEAKSPPDWWANQSIATTRFDPERTYTLSAWMKAEAGAIASVHVHTFEAGGSVTEVIRVVGPSDWQYVETSFVPPTDVPTVYAIIDVTPMEDNPTFDVSGWFDDVAITVE